MKDPIFNSSDFVDAEAAYNEYRTVALRLNETSLVPFQALPSWEKEAWLRVAVRMRSIAYWEPPKHLID